MNKIFKKILFIIIPVFIGFALIWFYFKKFTPEQVDKIIYNFKNANYFWIIISLFFAALSHLSRAYRWQFLLKPLGYKPRYANSVLAVLIAYFFNLVIPRSGEIARATTLTKYDNIPFEKAFGTVVTERIVDLLMLLLIIIIAFFLQADLIESFLFRDGFNPINKIIYLSVFLGLGLLFYYFIKKSKNPIAIKIKNFTDGLKDGVFSILKMDNKWQFIFHSFFIWGMYLLMFYVASFALPETANLSINTVVVGFVAGTFAMIFFPGGLGGYPVFVASALSLYAIPEEAGTSLGLLIWTSQTIMILLLGALAFVILPIYNKK